MRIAYILQKYPSLSETFIDREIQALRRSGFEIDIYALDADESATRIEPVFTGSDNLNRLIAPHSEVVRTQRWRGVGARWWASLPPGKRAIDHVHGGFAGAPAAIAWGAAAAAGLPWSFSGHARDIRVSDFDLPALASAASFVTACTRSAQAFMRQSPNGEANVLYAPHGLELARYAFRETIQPAGQTWRLVTVGRLVEKKGHPTMLAALGELKRRHIACHATIIGEGPLRDALEQQGRQLELHENLFFAGAMGHEAAMTIVATAHCFVFCGCVARDGDQDGLPNVILEAAALGVPVVATTGCGIGDFLDETTGWPCVPRDPISVVAAIEAVFAQPAVALQRAMAARRRVEECFDIDRNIKVLAHAFKQYSGNKHN